jgi:hypothetical protein
MANAAEAGYRIGPDCAFELAVISALVKRRIVEES